MSWTLLAPYYTMQGPSIQPSALSTITACQTNGTQAIYYACHQLLDYVATHPNAGLWYHACDMILAIHTRASYLLEAGGGKLSYRTLLPHKLQ
jgi:hypothetical protein